MVEYVLPQYVVDLTGGEELLINRLNALGAQYGVVNTTGDGPKKMGQQLS